MHIDKIPRDSLVLVRSAVSGGRSLLIASSLLTMALVQSAMGAPVIQQTVMQLKSLGQTTIHGGPVSSSAVALPEIQPGDDSTVGVKNQTAGIAPSEAILSAPKSFLNRHHGLAIPSKTAHGAVTDSASRLAASSVSLAAGLPPPPTTIPNPR